MATHKDALKRLRQNKKKNTRNRHYKSMMRTQVKKFRTAAEAGEVETLNKIFPETVSLIHKLSSKGIIHKNQASRRISRLSALKKKVEQN
jgi:small subunit ribosomal protein S20